MFASKVIEHELVAIERVKFRKSIVSNGLIQVILVNVVIFYKPHRLLHANLFLVVLFLKVEEDLVVIFDLLILNEFKQCIGCAQKEKSDSDAQSNLA